MKPGAAAAERAALAVWIAGFGYGAVTHAVDFVIYGPFPYRFGTPAMNLFWNMLLLLDTAVVAFLAAERRRAGLTLGAAVMIADVVVNVLAWRALGLEAFATAVAVQTGFLGFVLGSIAFLWPAHARRDRVAA